MQEQALATEEELGASKEPLAPIVESISETGDEEEKPEPSPFKFEVPTIKYEDVIGMARPKVVLYKEIEQPLRNKERYEAHEESRSTGILLYGPPGTGKTMMAQAICEKLGLKMAYISGGSIMDKYVGQSGKHVKMLFETASSLQPCVVFIDEADVLLQNREFVGENSKELELTISEFLVQISKVREDKTMQIAIIGATNLPWRIDPAHKRSGRFDYNLYIPAPDFGARRKLFKLYIKADNPNMPKEDYGRINYWLLALATPSYSPADIKKICHVAVINEIGKKKMKITTRAIQRVLWSHEAGKSSLDSWYWNIKRNYFPKHSSIIKKIVSNFPLMGFLKKEEPKEETTKSKLDELKEYEDLVKDVNSHFRYSALNHMARVFGKGLPTAQAFTR